MNSVYICSHLYPGVPVSERQFTVSGLYSNTTYTMRVTCRDRGGEALCSQEMVITTSDLTSPRYSHLKQVSQLGEGDYVSLAGSYNFVFSLYKDFNLERISILMFMFEENMRDWM